VTGPEQHRETAADCSDTIATSGKAGAKRLDAIEWIRIASAIGVVWFHVPGGGYKDFGHAGLIAFILISVVFQAGGAAKEPPRLYFRKKLLRLGPPWAFWFAVYALGNLARGRELFPYSDGTVPNLLAGPWIGLWFLPFMLAASAGVYLMVMTTRRFNTIAVGAGALLLGLVLLSFHPTLHGLLQPVSPWAQWLHAAPALFLGVTLWSGWALPDARRRPALTAIVLLVITVCLVLFMSGSRNLAVHYGVAILAAGTGFGLRVRLWSVITDMGSLCLGVYLIHFIIMTLLGMLPFPGKNPFLLFALTVPLSFATAAILRRCRHLRLVC
jgi:peptidoglycan/LPS O-acetylase OafA/YrhL